MIIDFHSHFLPALDDGSKNTDMSLEMLKRSINCGVDVLVATPHFLPKNNLSVNDAVILRDKSFQKLKRAAEKINLILPDIRLGFEVQFYNELRNLINLDKLCIENTNCILVEMPYTSWDDELLENLFKLSISGYKLIMAHVDRYYRINKENTYKLFELDVMFQVNCDVFFKMKDRKFLKKMLEANRVCIVGSDMHNTTTRATKICEAYEISQKKFPEYTNDLFCNNAASVL